MRTHATTLKRARKLRREPTDAENKLWSLLRRRQIDGHHFRKQVPIGDFVVDFACLKMRLIIEVDGGQHALRQQQDAQRSEYLMKLGYQILRFWNNDILQNPEGVLGRLREALDKASMNDAETH
ncbi:MAG: endonuclease domain-containing protein [Rhodospirillaceae bacterium]|nr:MAG: endonuclease domain-containing protein [Rhodospirillaceae bacterium]